MAKKDEVLVSEQVLQVPFSYSAGPVASRFLIGLRDERKIYGLRCGHCRQVYVPPRGACPSCGTAMTEWVEVGPEGELANFTVIHYGEAMHPASAPFAAGIIMLKGAATGLVHLLLCPPADLKLGMRLRPVWAQERKGRILDLAGFEPAE